MKNLLLALVLCFSTMLSFAQRGKEGSPTFTTLGNIVNEYGRLATDATAGATSITSTNIADFDALGNFGATINTGDLLMVIQMQGYEINGQETAWGDPYGWPNNITWGALVNAHNCGRWEFVEVESISGNVINLTCGLRWSYTAAGRVQIVRVPRYDDLTVSGTGELVPTAWNGLTGGVLAVEIDGTATIDGTLDASSTGFRGGNNGDNNSLIGGGFYSAQGDAEGAEKGEGVVGYQGDYFPLGGRYGRGAAANAGGGGTSHNAGGGGGANGGNIAGWTGQGNPDISGGAGWVSAWDLESAGFSASTSTGGGRGGYTYADDPGDATTQGPGNFVPWDGDSRRVQGGIGGRPLDYNTGRLWLGGGGGAGEQNDGQGGDGGRGGGLVYVMAYGDVNGSGLVVSDGANGGNSDTPAPPLSNDVYGKDGCGGGGAGGTVVVNAYGTIAGGVTTQANGGDGGDQIMTAGAFFPGPIEQSEGPGGGGGGGYIGVSNGGMGITVNGGANGTTDSPSLTEFPPNGATRGGTGFAQFVNNYFVTATGATICPGQTATLNAAITGTAPGGTVINWYDAETGGNLLGTGASFVTPALFTTTSYWVGLCPGHYRIEVIVTVNPAVVIDNVATTDPNCGASDGQIVITASGGTTPYQYSIDNGVTFQASNTFTGLGAGTYDIVVEDAAGCQATTQVTLNNTAGPTIDNVVVVDPTCNGDTDGQITITVSGGTTPYQYSNDNGVTFQAGNNFAGLGAGTYDIVVEDAVGCQTSQQVTLTDPPVVTFTSSAVNPTCNGDTDGQIVLNGSGGDGGPYQYSIDNGGTFQASGTFAGLGGGTYDVVVEDASGCQTTGQIVLTDPALITYTVTITDENCGAGDGEIVLSGAGGDGGPYQYSIDNGVTFQASGIFGGLTAGSYNVVVEDATGCQATGIETVGGTGGPTISSITEDISLTCNGDCNAQITATVTGGTTPYTYSWEDAGMNPVGGNSPTLSNLCAGTYTLTVTDAGGGGPLVFWSEDFGTDPGACSNQNQLATATVLPNGSWSETIMAAEGGVPNQWFISATEAFTGTGNCGDGCLGNPALDNQTLHVGSLGVGLCPSGDCGAAYNAGANGETHKRIESPVIDCSGQSTITLTFDYMHFGETGTDAASLLYFDGVTWTPLTVPLPQAACCGGPCDGLFTQGQWSPIPYTIALPPSADNNPNVQIGFSWDNDGNNSGADPSFAVDNIELSAAGGGGGCSAVASFTVTEPPAVTYTAIATDPTCNSGAGIGDGSIVITGADGDGGPYQYSIDNGATFQASGTFTNLGPGTYNIVVEDASGCQVTGTETLIDPPPVAYTSLITPITCNGGTNGQIVLNGSGGDGGPYQYSIDNGVTFQASGTFAALGAGTYDIVVEDASGCQITGQVTLTDPPAVTYTAVLTNPTCGLSNGQIVLTGADGDGGPYSYSIDNGVTFQGSGTFTGLGAGTYDIVVEDGSGCQVTGQEVLTDPGAPVIDNVATVDPTCNGGSDGSITITASGGTTPYQYSIDNGVTFQAGNSFTGLAAGTYDIVVEDAIGCQVATQVVLSNPAPITYTVVITDPTCNGGNDGSIVITGAGGDGGPYQYSIDNGATFQGSGTFAGLAAATYDVVIEDASGCQVTGQETITDPPAVSIDNVTTIDPTCGANDGSIGIVASGGDGGPYQYSIDGGVTFQALAAFTNLGAGTYNIVVEDASGCQVTTTATLSNPGAPTIDNVAAVDPTCNGDTDGSITITVSGGTTPYQYSIDNGVTFQAGNSFTGLGAAAYDIVVEDAVGCQVSMQVTLTDPPVVTYTVTLTNPTCNGDTSGIIDIVGAGGDGGPYQYSIDNGTTFQASGTFNNLGAGTYDIVVEDASGCQVTGQETLTDPPAVTYTVTLTNPVCNGDTSGVIDIVGAGGDGGPYQYSIDNGTTFQASGTFNNLGAGTYDIVVEDASGCQVTGQETLTDPPAVTYTVTLTDPNCGASDGSIDIVGAGGDGGPYQYSIDNGTTFQASGTFTGLGAGTYDIVVEDGLGCQVIGQEILNNAGAASIDSIIAIDPLCFGDGNGSITIYASGGTPPLQYSIDNGTTYQAGNAFSGLGGGTFDVVVEDGVGCQTATTVTLTEPTALVIDSTATIDETCSAADGSINVFVSGGTTPYQYSIDGGNTFQASSVFGNLAAGTYDITVVDANGCTVNTGSLTIINDTGGIVVSFTYAPTSGCTPLQVDFTNTSSVTGTGGTYLWDFGDSNTSTDENPTHVYNAAGVYDVTLTVTDQFGCNATTTIVAAVTVSTAPTAAFTYAPQPVLAEDPLVTFTDGSTGNVGSWLWTFDNLGTDNVQNPTFTFPGVGSYTVCLTVFDSTGTCSDSICQVIEVTSEIEIPNVFSPNGDNENELFIIDGLTEGDLFIYNRWGQLMYNSNGYQNNWDGRTSSGLEVPEGTYYYILQTPTQEYTGTITLIR